LRADVGHVDPQVVGLLPVLGSPQVLEDLALGDELVLVAHEQFDDAPLGGSQADLLAGAYNALGGEVNGKISRGDGDRCLGGCDASQRGGQPGEELVYAERLVT
jgi:hypothetical protein